MVSAPAAVSATASMSAAAAMASTAVESTAATAMSTATVEASAALGVTTAVVTSAIATAAVAAATVAASATGVVAGATVEASATLTAEAMVAPAVAVAPVGPRTDAEEDAVVEVARAVVAVGSATVGGVAVVAVLAGGWRATEVDADADLGLGRWWGDQRHECQGSEQRGCTQEGLESAHLEPFERCLRFL